MAVLLLDACLLNLHDEQNPAVLMKLHHACAAHAEAELLLTSRASPPCLLLLSAWQP